MSGSQDQSQAGLSPNHNKFEVIQNTPISKMDIHQARTASTQEKMKAKMDIHQEKMEAAMHSIWSMLEETIKHRVKDVLLCVDQKA
jgi:hypothetical protein